jgi:branched-chain amino acid transport system substrate-binding protein
VLDDGTATAGQYDPAQSAINTRKMIVDPNVVAAVGPMASGSGKAMAPLLSQGNLATVTPSSTNPDLTDPKFAEIYRPAGKTIYFRTCTTDAFQGPNMANFMADQLKVKSVFVVDDTGAYGVGLADAFQAQAAKRGIKVMGRDRVDPLISDYKPLLTKIKNLGPDALYCGSSALAGVKLVKQSYELMPDMIKAGGDGLHQASILAAIEAVAKSGTPVTRGAVRDAIQAGKVDTLQGPIAYDANGDLASRVVSVFQVQQDIAHPVNDVVHQFKYIGVALADNS